MKKTGTRFLVGCRAVAMANAAWSAGRSAGWWSARVMAVLAVAMWGTVAARAQTMSFAANTETEFEQTAGSNPPEKYGRLAPSYFSSSLVSQGRSAEGAGAKVASAGAGVKTASGVEKKLEGRSAGEPTQFVASTENQFAPNTQTQFAPNTESQMQLAQATPAIKTATPTNAKTAEGGVEKKLGGKTAGGKAAGGMGEKWKPDVFRFSLLPSLAYFSYEEFVEGEPFMDIKGMVYGFESNVKINLAITPTWGFMIIPFDLAVYDGKQLIYTGGGDHFFDEGIFLFWIRGVAGPSITIASHYRFNFLTGYGYKYTENNYTNGGSLAYGQRTNKIHYIPLVLQFEYISEHFSVLAHGEYDIFLGGVQTQESRIGAEYSFWTAPQTKGYGFRTSGELAYYGVTIAPFFNYFWIDRTESLPDIIGNRGGAEPLNITTEYGVKIGYQF